MILSVLCRSSEPEQSSEGRYCVISRSPIPALCYFYQTIGRHTELQKFLWFYRTFYANLICHCIQVSMNHEMCPSVICKYFVQLRQVWFTLGKLEPEPDPDPYLVNLRDVFLLLLQNISWIQFSNLSHIFNFLAVLCECWDVMLLPSTKLHMYKYQNSKGTINN